ncbi:MAG: glycosyltransferase [Solobacterium sp.]|nr:glycosyltransferase [Solobacterium sp.]
MRIAFINTVSGYGSTGRLVSQLAGMDGTVSRIYYGRKKDLSGCETYRVTGPAGNIVHAVETRLFDRHGFCSAKETNRMIGDLKAFQPDLIHLHNLHGYYLHTEVLFRFLAQICVPVVWTFHDCWPFTGHCVHYEAVGCEQWKTGCRHCTQTRVNYKTYSSAHVRENYERKRAAFTSVGSRLHVAVPSVWLKDQVSGSFLKETDCTVIPNGIDLNTFHPLESDFRRKNNLENKTLILACSSIWTERKGFDQLAALSHDLPENAVLCIIGVSQRQKKQLPEHVIAISRTDSVRELAEIYSAADLLINPTQEETFSLVNLEAQACGIPVVTYRSGGSTETITDSTGIILEKNDLAGLRKVIERMSSGQLIFDKDSCVRNAQRFSIEHMLEGYRQLYQRVTGKTL